MAAAAGFNFDTDMDWLVSSPIGAHVTFTLASATQVSGFKIYNQNEGFNDTREVKDIEIATSSNGSTWTVCTTAELARSHGAGLVEAPIDFMFGASANEACPQGWTCSEPYASSGGGCGAYNGVFVGTYSGVLSSCNGCMTPALSERGDEHFFKIAWDGQCGHATSDAFTLPTSAAKFKFLIGGGAESGGFWLRREDNDAEVCSFVGPATCPMEW